MKYAGPETDPLHMRFMLDAELADAESALTQQFGLGWQTLEQWQALAQMLQQHGALEFLQPGTGRQSQFLKAVFPDIEVRLFFEREGEAGDVMVQRYRPHPDARYRAHLARRGLA